MKEYCYECDKELIEGEVVYYIGENYYCEKCIESKKEAFKKGLTY